MNSLWELNKVVLAKSSKIFQKKANKILQLWLMILGRREKKNKVLKEKFHH
jgi:hypothetical protein